MHATPHNQHISCIVSQCPLSYLMLTNNNNRPAAAQEYIDIPLHPEHSPLHLAEKLAQYALPQAAIDVGFDLITRLDEAIRAKNTQEMLSLYLHYYPLATQQHFTQAHWPKTHEIEASQEEGDFSAKVQNVYNELRLRAALQKKPSNADIFFETAEDAWDSYSSILEREYKEITFPVTVVWDIVDHLSRQFVYYYTNLPTIEDQTNKEDFVFDLKEVRKLLHKLSEGLPEKIDKDASSRELFGWYGLVSLSQIQVFNCDYRAALAILSRVSLESLEHYSKSIGALLSLFLSASYSYFMLEQYKESARVAEMVLLFYQKNKKYFAGLTGNAERNITQLFQQIAGLLCINYIFLEERPRNLIMEVFKGTSFRVKDKGAKEKLSDKYTKMRQHDVATFIRLFSYCRLPSIPEKNDEIAKEVLGRFEALQAITLNSILQHYTQISLSKMSRMLKISEQEVERRLSSFGEVAAGGTPWDLTIMAPLLGQTHKLRVEVSEGVVKLEREEAGESGEWDQYKKEIGWLVEKVNAL